jgi:hypothetical protein
MFRKVYIHRVKDNRKQNEREGEEAFKRRHGGGETCESESERRSLPHPGLTNQNARDGPNLPLNWDAATVRLSVWVLAHSHLHLKKRKARRHAGLVSRTS